MKEVNKNSLSFKKKHWLSRWNVMWCLVAGHVENGESATAAMIRETYEEIQGWN